MWVLSAPPEAVACGSRPPPPPPLPRMQVAARVGRGLPQEGQRPHDARRCRGGRRRRDAALPAQGVVRLQQQVRRGRDGRPEVARPRRKSRLARQRLHTRTHAHGPLGPHTCTWPAHMHMAPFACLHRAAPGHTRTHAPLLGEQPWLCRLLRHVGLTCGGLPHHCHCLPGGRPPRPSKRARPSRRPTAR